MIMKYHYINAHCLPLGVSCLHRKRKKYCAECSVGAPVSVEGIGPRWKQML